LDAETRRWWERRGLSGRRRISMFADGFYRRGLLGRSIWAGHVLARMHGVQPRELLACTTLPEQQRFFDVKISPLFERRLIRFLASRRASLFGLGIPPAQFKALAGSQASMAAVLRERIRRLVCDFPLSGNY